MSRALGPRPSAAPGGTAGGWAVLIATWSMVALLGLIWAAAAIAAALTGGRAEPFGVAFIRNVLHGRGQQAWPHTPTAAVVLTAVVLGAVITALAVGAVRLSGWLHAAPGDPVAALSRDPRMRVLTRRSLVRGAAGLRRSLAGADPRAVDPAQAGLELGRLLRMGGRRGPAVYASWEDTVVAFMAPRSGKTGTTRRSAGSRPSGTPGKCSGCAPGPASAPGTASISTTSCRS